MTNRQVVLFFVDRVFWPANDGHKIVLSNYCKGLTEKYGCEVHVLAFLEAGQSPEVLNCIPPFISSVQLVSKPSKWTITKNMALCLFHGSKGGPIQCALFKDKNVMLHLRSRVEELNPTHIFFDLPRLSSFVDCVEDLSCRKILYMEDKFSKRYDRQLKSFGSLNKTGSVAGKYSANFRGGLAKLASNPVLQRAVLATESRRMRQLELEAPDKFDHVVLVSPDEARSLARDATAENIVAIPLGVDYRFYRSGPRPNARKNILSFLGDMRTSANADSLRYIAKEVMPRLDSGMVLEVSGIAPNDLVSEFKDNCRVRFLGRVEDVRETLRSSSVFLAPIAYGSGVKTKILEAMAIGVPIVTNSIGNEGIGLVDGEEAFISDDASMLAKCALRLIEDRMLADEFIMASKRKAANCFDWEKSLLNFSQLGFKENVR